MGCCELAGQARINVRGGEHVADQGERGNSYYDRRAAIDASRENVLRRVDLRHGDQGNRIAGQDGARNILIDGLCRSNRGLGAAPRPRR
jgi:hypothetical protein